MANPLKSVMSLATQPGQTFRRLTLTSPSIPAFIAISGTSCSFLLSLWIAHHDIYSGNPAAFISLSPFYLLTALTGLLLFSAVWHFTADILGGAGRGLTLQYFVMLATLPFWFAGPFAVIFRLAFEMEMIFYGLLGALLLWHLILVTLAMKELYRFTFLKALGNLLLAPVVLTGLAYCLIVLLPGELQIPWIK